MKHSRLSLLLFSFLALVSCEPEVNFITTESFQFTVGGETFGFVAQATDGGTYEVDWGDGKREKVSSAAYHTYTDEKGWHLVKVLSPIQRFRITNQAPNLLQINQWGNFHVFRDDGSEAFAGATKLQITATDQPKLPKHFVYSPKPPYWIATRGANSSIPFRFKLSSVKTFFYEPIEATKHYVKIGNTIVIPELNEGKASYTPESVSEDVEIYGKIRKFSLGIGFSRGFLSEIKTWGGYTLIGADGEKMFADEERLFVSAQDAPDLSQATSLKGMFEDATNFNGTLSNWDVSNVTNMRNMFSNAYNFNADISNWDVSNVTDMTGMFRSAAKFNADISKWNVGNVQDMSHMFFGADSFDHDLSFWEVCSIRSEPTSFTSSSSKLSDAKKPQWGVCDVPIPNTDPTILVFQNYIDFSYTPLPNEEVWIVIDGLMRKGTGDSSEKNFFKSISSTTEVKIYGKYRGLKIAKVHQRSSRRDLKELKQWGELHIIGKDGENMFKDSRNLIISAQDAPDLSQATSLFGMFSGATDFDGYIGNWDVSNVTNMRSMFFSATKFNADISKWNVSNVEDMTYMFYGAHSFDQDLSSWKVCSIRSEPTSFTGFSSKLSDAEKPQWGVCDQPIPTTTPTILVFQNYIDFSYTPLPNEEVWIVMDGQMRKGTGDSEKSFFKDISQEKEVKIYGKYRGLKIAKGDYRSYPRDLKEVKQWGEIKLIGNDGVELFKDALNLEITATDAPDLSQATSLKGMFQNATNFNGDISKWDVSNVSNMSYMFYNTPTFDGDLSAWKACKLSSKPFRFDDRSNIAGQPQWGVCP